MVKMIKKIKVKDLETSITEWSDGKYHWNDFPKDFLPLIPVKYYNDEIYVFLNRTVSVAQSELFKYLNSRYILKQLGLNLQWTDRRETYYVVRDIMNGALDAGVNIKAYCEKLSKHLGYEYWAYSYEYLNIKPDETAVIYDTEMKTTTLSFENIKEIAKTTFFLIMCEKKEPLRATMEEMINRGYTEGFRGITTKGTSSSYIIKLLIELSGTRNFYIFDMTDLDLNGIVIHLDKNKWFPCESIGINPEMLAKAGVDFKDGCEDYKPENKAKTILGLKNTINKLDISEKQKEIYRNWIEVCKNKRFELNSLTALRLKEDINKSKARDFCDYLETKIGSEYRTWNLNRYKKPTYEEPTLYDISIYTPQVVKNIEKKIDKEIKDTIDKLEELKTKITKKQEEIKKEAHRELEDYLKLKNVKDIDDWRKLIEGKVNKMLKTNSIIHNLLCKRSISVFKKVLRKNRNYKGKEVVKYPETIITNQTKQLKTLTGKQSDSLLKKVKYQDLVCKRIIRTTPKYKEVKKELTENEKRFTETNLLNYVETLQKELTEIFKEIT